MMDFDKEIIMVRNETLSVRDLLNVLESLQIKEGDIVCVHSQIFGLGKPLVSKEEFMEVIIRTLQEIIGKSGMLIMPAFSYSFCKKEEYDVLHSPSTVGVLTEYYRGMPNVRRTAHPIFSFAVWGDRTDFYLDIGPDAFSLDSVYGKMIQDEGKILMFGANKGYTFYYLAEEHVNVRHRYFKNFEGQIRDDGGMVHTIRVPYMVRDLSMISDLDEEKLAEFLIGTGLQRQEKFGKGTVGVFSCRPAYDAMVKELKKDSGKFLIK